jgi:hypothetical protein
MTHAGRGLGILALLLLGAACKHGATTDGPAPTAGAPSAVQADTQSVDHLAPGELIEGSDQAFGVRLPRAVQVRAAFVDVVYADGSVALHPLVKYLRARVQEGSLREGEAAATFEHVRVRGKPGLELSIRIAAAPGGVRVEMRDTTTPPPLDLPDDNARWKHVGLTPAGRVADPTHLD